MKQITRNCGECRHLSQSYIVTLGAKQFPDYAVCDKLHKPRFYKPRNCNDDNYGWKRKCGDFEPEMKGTK